MLAEAHTTHRRKTAAAITGQAPVLVDNLTASLRGETELKAKYDGYASCRKYLRQYAMIITL